MTHYTPQELQDKLAELFSNHLPTPWRLTYGSTDNIYSLLTGSTILASTDLENKVIKINKAIMDMAPVWECWKDTLLHEIAHAFVGLTPDDKSGHGKAWVDMANKLGVVEPDSEPAQLFKDTLKEHITNLN